MELFRRTRSQTRVLRELEAFRTFPSLINSYFEPFIKDGEESHKFDWFSVHRFCNKFKDRLTNNHSLKIFCDFTLKLLLRFDCEDEILMKRIVFICFEFCQPNYFDYPCQYCQQSNCEVPPYFLDSEALLTECNFERYDSKIHFFYFFQLHVRFKSDYFFQQFMLKYGVTSTRDIEEDVQIGYVQM